MYRPSYLIKIYKNSFTENDTACLGTQLYEILTFLETFLTAHVWLGANIMVTSSNTNMFTDGKYEGFQVKKIGTLQRLKKELPQIVQFIYGVFFAVELGSDVDDHLFTVDTEDEEFRSLNVKGIILEIRTFDTSYFEIYSENRILMEKIAKKFSCTLIDKNDDNIS